MDEGGTSGEAGKEAEPSALHIGLKLPNKVLLSVISSGCPLFNVMCVFRCLILGRDEAKFSPDLCLIVQRRQRLTDIQAAFPVGNEDAPDLMNHTVSVRANRKQTII
jgi:hypothetical protein